jgi:hypothetical protein
MFLLSVLTEHEITVSVWQLVLIISLSASITQAMCVLIFPSIYKEHKTLGERNIVVRSSAEICIAVLLSCYILYDIVSTAERIEEGGRKGREEEWR